MIFIRGAQATLPSTRVVTATNLLEGGKLTEATPDVDFVNTWVRLVIRALGRKSAENGAILIVGSYSMAMETQPTIATTGMRLSFVMLVLVDVQQILIVPADNSVKIPEQQTLNV